MAQYKKITITNAGAQLISDLLTKGGDPLTFEAVAVGSGELAEGTSTETFTELIAEARRLPVDTIESDKGKVTVTARLATDSLTADLYHREIGVYANGILFAYGNTGDKYDYIPAAGSNAAVQKIIRVPLVIGTMQTTFAEMNTDDLVTHAALEARVATVVEPVVREIVTPEIAKEALNEAVHEVAKDVSEQAAADAYAAQIKAEEAAAQALISETNIDLALDKALFENGEYQTTSGTQDFTARCFEITKPVCGRVERIEIPCRSTTNAYDRMYKGTPVYLSVFEEDISGEWVHIGMSTNANTQTAGQQATWDFANLKLSGRPLRFIVVTARKNTAFDTSLYMGARVTASTAGAAYEESSLASPQNYLADVTFSGAYVAPKYAPAKHTENGDVHITPAERAAWNEAAAGGEDISGHIASAEIHVTAEERAKWNNAGSATAKVYTSYDELLDDDYGEVNHILFADKMPAGTRAAFKVEADLEAPLDQFGFLEIVKFDGQYALLTFTAYETDAEYYYPTAQYVAITDDAQVGEWKKITYSNI